ncbi:fatty acid synthase alpha subunit Lsd1 [Tieghemiomyces parasiticus]|uniref:Fatty acid synthase subunit alpha n=1 Tax=Tieghemiomyces parasiticus TaxID=78921 RepID=A0A9W8AC87_9FUNG|nr:fatty acid synthase alpha subunit Lsd1 [Tieghemiomyces parasiticus]
MVTSPLLSTGYVSIRAPTEKLSQAARPLAVKHANAEVSILVPGVLWVAAEQLRESFQFHLTDEAEAETAGEVTELELAARFLSFCVTQAAQARAETAAAFYEVARLVLAYIRGRFLKGNDIHVVATSTLDSEAAVKAVIRAYVGALTALRSRAITRPSSRIHLHTAAEPTSDPEVDGADEDPSLAAGTSALFLAARESRARLFAIFGGQGTSSEYFDETHDLFTTYEPLLRPFVTRMADVLRRHAADPATGTMHAKGMDVLSWLEDPETQPDDEYLVSAPVSLALIGLTQFMHYVVLCRTLDWTPGQVRDHFAATTGHSQGMIAAAVIAASSSWEEFEANAERGLGLLFWLGTRAQQVYPATTLNPAILQDSLSHNEGAPSVMLSISHLRHADVVQHVELTNSHLPEDRRIHVALVNGPRSTVCTGPAQSLYGLNLRLRKIKAPAGADQARVPYSKRPSKVATRFLPITVPFHSPYLASAVDLVARDIERYDLRFKATDLALPLLASDTGVDMRDAADQDVSHAMVVQICTLTTYWQRATDVPGLTHILDFGPGGLSGIGGLTYRNKEGTGVQVVFAGALAGPRKNMSYKPALFDTRPEAVRYSPDWARDFRPRLVRTTGDGQIHIATRMSRLLGKPPLMVAGMTPSTVSDSFVGAVLNAGYHIELAGGGHYNERALRRRVADLMARMEPGLGITLNMLFLNARQWAFQFPLVQAMRREGLPIEGVCVAAGVPSLNVANDIVSELRAAGLRHVGFKPSSIATILQVVAIAQHNPEMPILLQWTGGRAGGHHSYEDFYQPILETYAAIREQPNLVLVAGSGFGGADDTLPYLTGDWSRAFDYPPMPYDGILLGSRMMVAQEGTASQATKEAIVAAPGITQDAEWEQTYERPTGGVVTVNSELGEPIHKLATRGVLLWKELDETIFNLPRDKRLPALLAKKDYIIGRLNADSQKPWFGRKADGTVADLPEMTYREVVDRLVELMFVRKETRWIDPSLRNLVGDFLRRVEDRFSRVARESLLQTYDPLSTDPCQFLADTFWPAFPAARDQLLTSEDVLYFITLCRRRGQKPVPFIPVLDKDFDVWFKKDSLWQSEDLAAVVDEDVGRVCILQGPIAVRYATSTDQPAGEILGDIYTAHRAALKDRYYDNRDDAIPTVEYLGARAEVATPSSAPTAVTVLDQSARTRVFSLDKADVPTTDTWLELLAGPDYSWLRALLTAPFVVQTKQYADNPLRRLLAPRRGQTATVRYGAPGQPKELSVTQATGSRQEPYLAVCAHVHPDGRTLEVTVNERRDGALVPLRLLFSYVPARPYALVQEVMEGRNERIKAFYYHLWFGTPEVAELDVSPDHQFVARGERVDRKDIQAFCRAVGNQAEWYVDRGQPDLPAPVDFAIVVGWQAIIKALFPRFINGDLLRLVHLGNGFRLVEPAEPLRAGDVVDTVATLQAVVNTDAGKLVEVLGVIERAGKPVMEVTSRFLYRGHFTDHARTFRRTTETPVEVRLETPKDLAVLRAKEWLAWHEEENLDALLATPCVLTFRLQTHTEFRDRTTFARVRTTGPVTVFTSAKVPVQVAEVDYTASGTVGNPVLAYLQRAGHPIEQPTNFPSGGYSVMPVGEEFSSVVHAPASNTAYAHVSGDYNPIHVNPYFSDLAGLPGTITHGMWTSASTRKFVETFAADNHPARVTGYHVNFQGMVLPSDRLETKLAHVGMKNGKKLIRVETVNQRGEVVLDGTAEVDQPVTAYVFTGQGSQEQGMGMTLYESSEVARSIWDRADAHFMTNYGVSILEIVRTNPATKTVHFGGAKGQRIRTNYLRMTYEVADESGVVQTRSLFPEVTEDTPFYTFTAPNGLLSATQFTQPALTLMERAAFEDMRSKGLVQRDACFAGHSLGEYAALAAIGDLPLERLVDVVFYRGMTMQAAVARDAEGRSDYGPAFDETILRYIVDTIAETSAGLLEIVNYNVENWQYIVSGELRNLDALAQVLNFLRQAKLDLAQLLADTPLEEVKKQLVEIVRQSLDRVAERKAANDGRVLLERGYATIPLQGIDVPFHSSFLLNGVGPFRAYLTKRLAPSFVNVQLLSGKYIPNLTAQPFSLSKDYITMVYKQTDSHRLAKVLDQWDSKSGYASPSEQQRLGFTLLIELLAYQFASPVRWIETQDQLFKRFGVERLIEVGPTPTLCGMAERTLKFKYEAYDDAMTFQRVNLCYAKHPKEIYYAFDPVAEPEPEAAPAAAPAPAAAAAPAPVAAAPAAPQAPVAAAASVEDVPLTAVEVLHATIAQKLKKGLGDIALGKAIKDLVGGKSTLQNEILGDLQKEFGSNVPEKSEEIPLDELGEALGSGGAFTGDLGKHTSSLVAKMMSAKMPGGFNLTSAKQYLSGTYGLGPQRTAGVLLVAVTMEPAARLASEADARTWLDSVVSAYAARQGITLTPGGSGGASSSGSSGTVVDSAELVAMQTRQDDFVRQQLAVLARYLKVDLRDGHRQLAAEQTRAAQLQSELDLWLAEHGDAYAEGIRPIFDPYKARVFDSYWNWARQDALLLYFDIVFGRLTDVDRDVTAQCLHVMNRTDPGFLRYMDYHIRQMPQDSETYRRARDLATMLRENCKDVLNLAPVYKDVAFPTAPLTTITAEGRIEYCEAPREGLRKLEDYVSEMARGSALGTFASRQRVQYNLGRIYRLVQGQTRLKPRNRAAIKNMYGEIVRALHMNAGVTSGRSRSVNPRGASTSRTIGASRRRRPSISATTDTAGVVPRVPKPAAANIPYLHLRRKTPTGEWAYNATLTHEYLEVLGTMARDGLTFENKMVLVTGCGRGSIGAEILKGLLSGGAQVVVTTSRYNRAATSYYQSIYHRHGSKGSTLVVVPFNQGSAQDVAALVDFIYSTDKATGGLGWDLDYIVPFAAIPENGREISDLDSKSELAHRAMLTNLLRLLGHVKTHKLRRGSDTRPAQVILPLSPNHGTFGSDGLYSESKLGLETLFNRWHSESWGSYLTITGAVIGWTRGTGLMAPNNLIAQGLEALGVRTFSAQEMSFNLLGLMHPRLAARAQHEPVWADLNGCLQFIPDLQAVTRRLRAELTATADLRRAVKAEATLDFQAAQGAEAERAYQRRMVTPRANLKFSFPELKAYDGLAHLRHLQGMLDLDNVVVVTGYSEVGPYGNSRTRWEMEAFGEFSLEGCIEMAWIMGYIRHHTGPLPGGKGPYSGWVDAKTLEPVRDVDVKTRYEAQILAHTGIRLIEPELVAGYQPEKKLILREVVIDHDLEPFEASPEEAAQFVAQNGEFVDVAEHAETGQFQVRFRKGATLMVPKALRFDRLVAGQIPTGWDAARYGVPQEIIDQVDRITLFVLVATVESLVASGITDPYEFYKYVHVSEVGNCCGSGVGGMYSLSKMYRDRLLDKPVQNDILQETFINTMAAWVNLLLLSSSGPIKTPVGACATAVESVELGVETIQSGKAKIVLVGGYDDFQEEGSYEFGNMKATSSTDEEFKRGRTPQEMSRPATTTRSGFMESFGAGIEVLMSASVALEMGVPVYGIIALTNTATDKEGRSVPAPGQGILTTAREITEDVKSPLLDIKYRRRQLDLRRRQIKDWVEAEYAYLEEEVAQRRQGSAQDDEVSETDFVASRTRHIAESARRQEKEALQLWGNFFYRRQPEISPLRGALASFGLTIDDVGVASFHGTSTKANDKNESEVLNKQFAHLGRAVGNACPSIFQKYLTGHPKGAAAAWMLNGVLQVLQTGIIPGNRNADNIDAALRPYEYVLYPSRSIHTDGVKAGLLKSFGFGQVGGEVLVIHPDYLFGALDRATYEAYRTKNRRREAVAYRYWHDAMAGVSPLFRAKTEAPYSAALESAVYLNPLARADYSAPKGTYVFKDNAGTTARPATDPEATAQVLRKLATGTTPEGDRGVGVDVELLSAVNVDNATFVERNFTDREVAYCRGRPDSQASFAGRWSAKEAVIKAVTSYANRPVFTQGAAAPLKDIEILSTESGAPEVVFHGEARRVAHEAGVRRVKVSISHSGEYAVALALASDGSAAAE